MIFHVLLLLKVGATDGNDGKHTKGGIDFDRRNLIRGGSVVGYRSQYLRSTVII